MSEYLSDTTTKTIAAVVAIAIIAIVVSKLKKKTQLKQSQKRYALLIIDVQNDFCPPNGSLAVAEGTKVIPIINGLRALSWDLIACTIDWHPRDHVSFHSNNPGSEIMKPFRLGNGNEQMMWPNHCVQGSAGAELHKDLRTSETDRKVYKGQHREVDSYSGFYDNDHKSKTELESVLRSAGITDVVLAGLAYDYCVGFSALDAKQAGFGVTVVEDATRGVAPETTKAMRQSLLDNGVKIMNSSQIHLERS